MEWTKEDQQRHDVNMRRVTVITVGLIWALVALILWLPMQGVPTGVTYDHDCTDGAYVKEAHCAR